MANAVRFSYTGKPRKTNLFFWVFYKHFSLLVFKAFLYSSNAAVAPSLRLSSKKGASSLFSALRPPLQIPYDKIKHSTLLPRTAPVSPPLKFSFVKSFIKKGANNSLIFQRYAHPQHTLSDLAARNSPLYSGVTPVPQIFHQANFPSKEGGYSPPF